MQLQVPLSSVAQAKSGIVTEPSEPRRPLHTHPRTENPSERFTAGIGEFPEHHEPNTGNPPAASLHHFGLEWAAYHQKNDCMHDPGVRPSPIKCRAKEQHIKVQIRTLPEDSGGRHLRERIPRSITQLGTWGVGPRPGRRGRGRDQLRLLFRPRCRRPRHQDQLFDPGRCRQRR